MQEKLVEFANLLRENGVRVSLAETLDAFSASEVTGLAERDAFRAALRATMVKRASELPVFEELFDIYFSGLGEIIKQASQAVQNALSMSDQEFQKFLDEVEKMLKKEGKNLSELAKQLLQNNSGEMERKIREASRAVKLQGIERTIEENYFARALARRSQVEMLKQRAEPVDHAREAIAVARRVGDSFAELNATINMVTQQATRSIAPPGRSGRTSRCRSPCAS